MKAACFGVDCIRNAEKAVKITNPKDFFEKKQLEFAKKTISIFKKISE